ncbi:MAG: Carnitine transport ATP-binding protein OpuCA [Bacteroidia bacterium]|nr:Carnitine transport ATP-binding protein OpuCA [Bacteroidia bacterium]
MSLELKHITFSFSPEKQILKDISLSLEQGKIYALMGSNGAGKTTLFNLISGFIKLQSGEIFFGEKNLTHQQPYKINRQGIGRTFQDLRLITKLTVRDNIILAMKNNPTDNIFNAMLNFRGNVLDKLVYNERTPDAIAEKYFLSDVIDSFAGEISYGQQKLLSLACCVANGAMLLLLDEPVAGIQPEYRNRIATLIKQMKEQGKTILLIEHNTDFISEVADKIFFLHDGKISDFANVESLRADKTVMEAYI